MIHGCKDSHTGGFADILVADPGMCFLLPQRVGLEEACTLGVGWVSATQALQQRLFKEAYEEGKGLGERDAVILRTVADFKFVEDGQFDACVSLVIIARNTNNHLS